MAEYWHTMSQENCKTHGVTQFHLTWSMVFLYPEKQTVPIHPF